MGRHISNKPLDIDGDLNPGNLTIVPLWERDSSTNFAGSAASEEVWGLQVLLVLCLVASFKLLMLCTCCIFVLVKEDMVAKCHNTSV